MKRLFLLWIRLLVFLQAASGTALAYTVSGSVYNGTANGTANVYVVLMNNGTPSWPTGFGTTITNTPAGGTATCSIRGVPGNQYQQYRVFAFMDVNSTGSLHINDPYVLSSTFQVTSDIPVGQLSLPAISVPPQAPTAPTGVQVTPSANSAMVKWKGPTAMAGGSNGVSAEIADSYTIYWGLSPNRGNGSAALNSKDVPANGKNNVALTSLPAASLYFTVKAHTGAGDASASTGPITIAAPTGNATVSGRIYSAGTSKTSTSPILIALRSHTTATMV